MGTRHRQQRPNVSKIGRDSGTLRRARAWAKEDSAWRPALEEFLQSNVSQASSSAQASSLQLQASGDRVSGLRSGEHALLAHLLMADGAFQAVQKHKITNGKGGDKFVMMLIEAKPFNE